MQNHVRRLAARPVMLWLVFLAVHLWLGYDGLTHPGLPFGDVTNVYLPWVEQSLDGYRLGIDGPWVYPVLAFLPMLASLVLGADLYGVGWMLVVTVANAAVFSFLIAGARETSAAGWLRIVAAWWWLAFLLLVGPVAVGRIDVFTVALAIVGLLLARNRPAVAGVLLGLATWVKVWPAVLIAAAVVAVRRRLRFAVAAASTLVAVAAGALAAGGGLNVFSFVTEQTGRGLQVESPVSTIWMWLARASDPSRVYYDFDILTFQVSGPGSDVAAAVMTPLLVVAVLAVLVIAVLVTASGASPTSVLPPLSLALVMALIVFNKVGSPQFMVWIAAPVILGIVTQGRRFQVPALLAFVMAGLTQVIYPIAYDWLLYLDPVMLVVLTVRNTLSIALLVIAVRMLWKSRKPTTLGDEHAGGFLGGSLRGLLPRNR
ncbi:glycosyltransferase family 87 protein [Herbiconiux liukaitaii]|uniref:glycosyltransferase family 87 protein n=1 Tax=Herbiconiux liukaitaii TaxID=3342799 RepID=UPI0035B93802